jgi:putative oxidoreductase
MAIQVGKQRVFRLNKRLRSFFKNSWIELIARWILGITFIYASYHKIISPGDFAKIIYGYDLLPDVLINLIAVILPFVELFSGLALILGIYPVSAVLIVNGMLLTFIIALSINLVRGHEFDCGCFSFGKTGYSDSVLQLLVRDIMYFFLGLQVFFYNRRRKWCIRQGR